MGRSDTGADAYAGEPEEQPEHDVAMASFFLDRFEVTVGRFRRFVDQFDGTPPAAGAGAHPLLVGSGWQSQWDAELPATRAELNSSLQCYTEYTWTDAPGSNEANAISCVSWYEAFAFCIWDGGRLPTEAEWEYAAAGGAENRLYPWGPQAPDSTRANYEDSERTPFVDVWSHPAGAGNWGQEALAGGMWEWVLDWHTVDWYSVGPTPCDNCANLNSPPYRGIRGGAWPYGAIRMRAAARESYGPGEHTSNIGFRCARSLNP